MKKLVSALLLALTACNATTSSTQRRFANETEVALTQVDLNRYRPQRPRQDITVDTRSLLRQAPAEAVGIEMYTRAQINEGILRIPRNHVVGPFPGVCVNNVSLAHIDASTRQAIRTVNENNFTQLETIGANAIRDINLLQNDFGLLRAAYQARVNQRDIALREADATIETLRRSPTSNVWFVVGLTVGGIALASGTTAAIILLSR